MEISYSFGPERESGGLDNIAEYLKAHGGKLIRTEEDEEEEGDDEEKVEDLLKKRRKFLHHWQRTRNQPEMVADTLADLMSKVHVG